MKLTHGKAIVLSGLLWLAIGFLLMLRGMDLLSGSFQEAQAEKEMLPWIIGALLVGFLKGRYVLAKAAKRITSRILSLPSPVPFLRLYDKRYLLLLLAMVALGVSFRFLGLPEKIRGVVDLAIGSALINGSMAYFRTQLADRKTQT